MKVKVRRVGNSLAVTIPKETAMDLRIGPDTEMDVSVREGCVVMEPVGSRWDRLVSEVRRQAREREVTEGDIERAVAELRGRGPERMVLDTNVLLSAVLFGARPGELLDHARTGRIRGVTSIHILEEFRRVLIQPRFGLPREVVEDLAVEMATFLDVVAVEPSAVAWTDDPTDDPVVETALQGDAVVIVSGDQRLLRAAVPRVRMLTVAEALEGLASG